VSSAASSSFRLWRELWVSAGAAALVMSFAAPFAVLDPAYFWRDDFQANYLPQLQQVANAVRQGEFPLLVPGTWQAGNTGGEFQFGIFSPWSLACVTAVFSLDLSLPLTAAVLSIVHLGLMAAGASRLARSRGLPVPESMLVAVVASLNGWMWAWGAIAWFVALAGLAWLPWAWWGLERAIDRETTFWRTIVAGLLIALLITGGWHFGCLMLSLVSLGLLARAATERRLLFAWKRVLLAWSLGLGLSAPAWLMLVEYSPHTLRGSVSAREISWAWSVPVAALPGLLVPAFSCTWSGFTSFRPHNCVELAGAFVPVAAVIAGLVRLKSSDCRRLIWDIGMALIVLALAMGPGIGNFRWSFRWLPLFFLFISLAGAQALALLRCSARGSIMFARWSVPLAAAGLGMAVLAEESSLDFALRYGAGLLVACMAGAMLIGRRLAFARVWFPVALSVASLWPYYARPSLFLEVPTWRFTNEFLSEIRLPGEITYLGVYGKSDIYRDVNSRPACLQESFGGNSFLYDGYTFVNGYSPLRFAGLSQLFGFGVSGAMSEDAAERVLRQELGPDGLLELLGVDGLVLIGAESSTVSTPELRGWQRAAKWNSGEAWIRRDRPSRRVRVLQNAEWIETSAEILQHLSQYRNGPLPLLVHGRRPESSQSLGSARVRIARETRTRIEIDVSEADPERSILVAVSRPWYPGYVARLNGFDVPVQVLDMAIPVVLLPPGANGNLSLDFRPASLRAGICVCDFTIFAILFATFLTAHPSKKPRKADTG